MAYNRPVAPTSFLSLPQPPPNMDPATAAYLAQLIQSLRTAFQEISARSLFQQTFMPVLEFGGVSTGITYSTQFGSYVRNQQFYSYAVQLVLTSKGAATGNATITGLPSSALIAERGLVTSWANMSGVSTDPIPVYSGSALGLFTGPLDPGSSLADTNFTNTTTITLAGTYIGTS